MSVSLLAWNALFLAALYLALLALLARWGEQQSTSELLRGRSRAWVHGLALGVYCSTWTVFGAIGSAVREGYAYLPIYLGPLALSLAAPWLWERMVRLKQHHRLASVADLLGARFGRGTALPALVALVALVAIVPYIALQLTAFGGSLAVLGVKRPEPLVLAFAALMVWFTVRFGVQDARTLVERPGLVLVLAIESAFKLTIVLVIALWAWPKAGSSPAAWHAALSAQSALAPPLWLGQCVLAASAALLLPRMFQVAVVECADVRELRLARRVFAGYLLAVSLAVLPVAGLAMNQSQSLTGSDFLLLSLPLNDRHPGLALAAFLAGLSAASAMMIAAWLALSTMLSNDLLVPWLVRNGLEIRAPLVLRIRRISVLGTAAASVLWYLAASSGTLAQMGLLAFAGVAHFAPPVLAALYAPGSSARGAFWGLAVGAAAWLTLLLAPAWSGVVFTTAELIVRAFVALAANAFTLIALSIWQPATLRQRLNAASFLAVAEHVPEPGVISAQVQADDVYTLCAKLLGEVHFRQALAQQFSGVLPAPGATASTSLIAAAERAVAEVFGSASARELIQRGLSGRALAVDTMLSALDQSSTRYRVSAQMLRAMFDHMHQAVSVVDSELRLVAWNRHYEALFHWPPDLLQPLRPIADLIEHAARVSGLDEAQTRVRVSRRLAQLRSATRYRSQRSLPDGRTLDVRGEPLPEGGFVTTFFDVSESVRAAKALSEANALLEARVRERTRELERVSEIKNQFLAAASHDLMQPLSAARLYLAAAQSTGSVSGHRTEADRPETAGSESERSMLQRAEAALATSEELLSGLTDLARLETGILRPESVPIELATMFGSLHNQAMALAEQRGLRLRVMRTRAWVRSDPRLLRRILQNYLVNGLRYTARGGVALGLRRCGREQLKLVVYDTGPGLDQALLQKLFTDLPASAGVSPWGERGLGLGLSGCKRLADALGHPVGVETIEGVGSAFWILVPRASGQTLSTPTNAGVNHGGRGLRVLCIDDDAEVRNALTSLLSRWGAHVLSFSEAEQALTALTEARFDLALVDYALGADKAHGLDVLRQLRAIQPDLRAALFTAESASDLPQRCQELGVGLLRKPLRPASLRAWLQSDSGSPAT